MKQCPQCKRSYPDETLNYCLDDGAELISNSAGNENPTAMKSPGATSRSSKPMQTAERTELFPAEKLSSSRTSKSNFLIIAAVAAIFGAVGVFVYRMYYVSNNSPVSSIAVLPFKNRGGDAETQYLSEGLAESLIYRLSQLPDLKVSPTSSVFRYEDKDVDPLAIGNELGVNAVLSGRIVPHGDSITISANLVDVRNNRLIWGEQYDRKMSQLLDTQREIAKEIVENLRLKVAPNEKGLTKHYTESNEAYQLYMKGRFYWSKRTNESMHKSIDLYKQAIESDPNFALAYSGLADTYNLICAPEAGGGDESPNDVLPKAKVAALRAMEIDPTLAEPHVSLAHGLMYYDRDFAGAEREFKKAIELNPKYATAHHWYAIYMTIVGRQKEALTEIKLAQELDPLSLAINVWVGWIMAFNGEADAALDQILKTKEMDPNFLLTRHRLALLYADRGMYKEALAEGNEMLNMSSSRVGLFTLAYVYAKMGKRKEALDQIRSLVSESQKRFVSPASIAMIYGILGDKDEAFKWLERANEEHDLLALRVRGDPRFANLQGDPRLDAFIKRIGLPQ